MSGTLTQDDSAWIELERLRSAELIAFEERNYPLVRDLVAQRRDLYEQLSDTELLVESCDMQLSVLDMLIDVMSK